MTSVNDKVVSREAVAVFEYDGWKDVSSSLKDVLPLGKTMVRLTLNTEVYAADDNVTQQLLQKHFEDFKAEHANADEVCISEVWHFIICCDRNRQSCRHGWRDHCDGDGRRMYYCSMLISTAYHMCR